MYLNRRRFSGSTAEHLREMATRLRRGGNLAPDVIADAIELLPDAADKLDQWNRRRLAEGRRMGCESGRSCKGDRFMRWIEPYVPGSRCSICDPEAIMTERPPTCAHCGQNIPPQTPLEIDGHVLMWVRNCTCPDGINCGPMPAFVGDTGGMGCHRCHADYQLQLVKQ